MKVRKIKFPDFVLFVPSWCKHLRFQLRCDTLASCTFSRAERRRNFLVAAIFAKFFFVVETERLEHGGILDRE